jgi:hypothetical protein
LDPAPAPDPAIIAIFVSDLQDTRKNYFFCLLLFEGAFTYHKTVGIKVFLAIFA